MSNRERGRFRVQGMTDRGQLIGAALFLALIAAALLLVGVVRHEPGGEQSALMPQPVIAGAG